MLNRKFKRIIGAGAIGAELNRALATIEAQSRLVVAQGAKAVVNSRFGQPYLQILPSGLMVIRKNSTGDDFGPRRRLNLIEGSNVTLTVADDATNDEVDVTIAAAGGGGVTVEEVDGSPTYASTTTVRFDQSDGFVVSQPAANVARVDQQDASISQAGKVNVGNQVFKGAKDFAIGSSPTYNIGLTDTASQLFGTLFVAGVVDTTPALSLRTVTSAGVLKNDLTLDNGGLTLNTGVYAIGGSDGVSGTGGGGDTFVGGICTALGAGGGAYTDENAQDAVGGILVDSSTIDFTYNDATPSITAIVIDGSITYAKIQNVSTHDRILGRVTAGAGSIEEITCTAAGRALLDDASATDQRTTLGLGTLATQNAGTVNITGGNITGVALDIPNANLHVYDTDESHTLSIRPGSNLTAARTFTLTTGDADRTLDISAADVTISSFAATYLDDADQAATRTTLGVGTGDSPQFTAVNLGHASDTTITRTAAGSIAVEGNVIYRAGGTLVAVTDGGTGQSTLTDHGVLVGAGTSAVHSTAAGAADLPLLGNGALDPTFRGLVPASLLATGWADVIVYLGTNQSLTQSAWNTINLDTETTDTDSRFNSGTYTFTPATTGLYAVFFTATLNGATTRSIAAVWVGTSSEVVRVGDGYLVQCGGTAMVSLTASTGYTFRVFPVDAGVSATAGATSTFLVIRRLR